MKTDFITFRSVTPAQRGQRLLQKVGIPCALQRTPRWMEERGCGYCLRLRHDDIQNAAAILQQEQLAFGKIYVGTEDGVQELGL